MFCRRFGVHADLARSCGWLKSTGSLGDDPGRVHLADGIAIDDVIARLHGVGYSGHPVEFAHVVRQVGIVSDALSVALVEAHKRRKQPPIGFGDLTADQISLLREPSVQPVEKKIRS